MKTSGNGIERRGRWRGKERRRDFPHSRINILVVSLKSHRRDEGKAKGHLW